MLYKNMNFKNETSTESKISYFVNDSVKLIKLLISYCIY